MTSHSPKPKLKSACERITLFAKATDWAIFIARRKHLQWNNYIKLCKSEPKKLCVQVDLKVSGITLWGVLPWTLKLGLSWDSEYENMSNVDEYIVPVIERYCANWHLWLFLWAATHTTFLPAVQCYERKFMGEGRGPELRKGYIRFGLGSGREFLDTS